MGSLFFNPTAAFAVVFMQSSENNLQTIVVYLTGFETMDSFLRILDKY